VLIWQSVEMQVFLCTEFIVSYYKLPPTLQKIKLTAVKIGNRN